ncbi:unnamed protein product [Phytophthora fragariaefolia]|uniref:Unnamed protein product n=1 Tax=Phytophthora fragariaefolia TaxID=1490495 RepID=A0A9W6UCA4_9STRA|nr:unnamed protein product [Phytophthora fragariaefolia]
MTIDRFTLRCIQSDVVLQNTILKNGKCLGEMQWSGHDLDQHLQAFAEADFANSTDDTCRKSVAGYLTKVFESIISWSIQTERTVALHTIDAVYMALRLFAQEVVHLRQMLKELRATQKAPTEVHVDTESAVKLARNPTFHSRTKHIDARHHFVREEVEMKQIDALRVPGVDDVADAFTKPLPKATF